MATLLSGEGGIDDAQGGVVTTDGEEKDFFLTYFVFHTNALYDDTLFSYSGIDTPQNYDMQWILSNEPAYNLYMNTHHDIDKLSQFYVLAGAFIPDWDAVFTHEVSKNAIHTSYSNDFSALNLVFGDFISDHTYAKDIDHVNALFTHKGEILSIAMSGLYDHAQAVYVKEIEHVNIEMTFVFHDHKEYGASKPNYIWSGGF